MGAHDLKDSSNSESKTKALPSSAVFELSQEFYFEAAHTLEREFEAEGSRRIHGHTYHAKVSVTGIPDPLRGMVVDLAVLREEICNVREILDHQLLDEIQGLGPATLENLSRFIADAISVRLTVSQVSVSRSASGDSCVLRLND